MRQSPHRLIAPFIFLLLPVLGVLLTGCAAPAPEPVFMDYTPGGMPAVETPEDGTPVEPTVVEPAAAPSVPTAPAAPVAAPAAQPRAVDLSGVLDVGDTIVVTLSGIATDAVPPHEERIKDDGTISLYLLGTVKAAGLTAGELQRELQKQYERFFKNPVVTVNTAPRYYYVGGEVKRPGAQPYLGKTTVTKAIQAAGDFTDFGRKGDIQVIRTDGTKLKVNFKKAIREPSLDPPIYPGDKIHVPRRHIW